MPTACGPLGALCAAYLADRFQRKWSVTVIALFTAAFGFAYGLSFDVALIMLFGGLMTTSFQTFAPRLYAYTAESFPTEVRSTGTGFTYGMGRLANAAGPFLIAYLFSNYGYLSVYIYIAVCWSAVAVAIGLFGPKATGRHL